MPGLSALRRNMEASKFLVTGRSYDSVRDEFDTIPSTMPSFDYVARRKMMLLIKHKKEVRGTRIAMVAYGRSA